MNTSATDTLAYNIDLVNTWQADPSYYYNRELLTPDINIMEWLSRQIGKLLQELFGSRVMSEYGEVILIVLVVLLLLFFVWFIYKKRPSLFLRSYSQTDISYEVSEDTIYGIDFEKAISHAVTSENYREAVRLLYLQTLKLLNDEERIVWQPYKTPTQYIYEVRMGAFSRLTDHFLRVRYGNFEATEMLFRSMCALQGEVKKGGDT